MFPRLAVLALFTTLLQPSWMVPVLDCGGFFKPLTDHYHGYKRDFDYQFYEESKNVPNKGINDNGNSIMIGDYYERNGMEVVGFKDDISNCEKLDNWDLEAEHSLPKIRLIVNGEPGNVEKTLFEDGKNFNFHETSVWNCKIQRNPENGENVEFLRILNDFENKDGFPVKSVKYLSGVEVKKESSDSQSQKYIARIKEIKYFHSNGKLVEYNGKVKLLVPKSKVPAKFRMKN